MSRYIRDCSNIYDLHNPDYKVRRESDKITLTNRLDYIVIYHSQILGKSDNLLDLFKTGDLATKTNNKVYFIKRDGKVARNTDKLYISDGVNYRLAAYKGKRCWVVCM